jgi:hypothetical protein
MSRNAKKLAQAEPEYDEEEYEYESEESEEIEEEVSDNDEPEEEPEDFEPEVPEYSEELVRDKKTGRVYVAIVNHRGETVNYYPVKAAPKGKAHAEVAQLVSQQREAKKSKKSAPKPAPVVQSGEIPLAK